MEKTKKCDINIANRAKIIVSILYIILVVLLELVCKYNDEIQYRKIVTYDLLEESAVRDINSTDNEKVFIDNEAIALADEYSNNNLITEAMITFNKINDIRKSNGLNSLTWNFSLESDARVRASEAVHCWSHTRPDGTEWWTVDSINMYGENLARGYKTSDTVINAWMNSETHKQNILKQEYKSCAIAIIIDNDGNYYWAHEFGY